MLYKAGNKKIAALPTSFTTNPGTKLDAKSAAQLSIISKIPRYKIQQVSLVLLRKTAT
jgi:hypothetical protein